MNPLSIMVARLHVLQVGLDHAPHGGVRVFVPERLVEDFDFDGAGVTGALDGLAQRADVDDAIAHHAAAKEQIAKSRGQTT